MRVIIAGSRSITLYSHVFSAIIHSPLELSDITEVISGTANGVDKLGEKYAILHKIPIKEFKPRWDLYGKAAGFRRNTEMAQYADFAVIVWDGQSAGSWHMRNTMENLGKPYYLHKV